MKLKELSDFDQGVAIIMKDDIDFKLAYRLTKIVKKIEPELVAFQEAQKVLFAKYAKENKEGVMEVPQNKREDFAKKIDELLEEDIKFDFELIPIKLLEEQKTIKTEVLIKLYPFIDEKVVEETPKEVEPNIT